MTKENSNTSKKNARSGDGSADRKKMGLLDNFELGGMNRWRQIPATKRDLAEK